MADTENSIELLFFDTFSHDINEVNRRNSFASMASTLSVFVMNRNEPRRICIRFIVCILLLYCAHNITTKSCQRIHKLSNKIYGRPNGRNL